MADAQITLSYGRDTNLVPRLLLGVPAAVVPLSHLAWLSGNITTYLTGSTGAPYQPTDALLRPDRLWPQAGETSEPQSVAAT